MTSKARRLTEELFGLLHADPATLPGGWRAQAGEGQPAQAAQVVCDYIAGMTDRFAQEGVSAIDRSLDAGVMVQNRWLNFPRPLVG